MSLTRLIKIVQSMFNVLLSVAVGSTGMESSADDSGGTGEVRSDASVMRQPSFWSWVRRMSTCWGVLVLIIVLE